jgi:uncharacterized protein involved in outer membrane biogenesis
MKTVFRIVKWLLVLLVLAAGGLAVFLLTLDLEQYRDVISSRLSAATGREIRLKGPISLSLGFNPGLVIEDIEISNPDWASRPDMATAGRLEAQVRLLPLLHKDIRIIKVSLEDADILLERDSSGRENWDFRPAGAAEAPASAPAGQPASSGAAAPVPEIESIGIRNSLLAFRDGGEEKASVRVRDLTASARRDQPLDLSADADWKDIPVTLALTGGRLDALDGASGPWPVDARIRAAGFDVTAKGGIAHPLEGTGLALDISAEGDRLSSLNALAGSELPDLGPAAVSGRLTGGGQSFNLAGLAARLGDLRLTGSAGVDLSGARPHVTADLAGDTLDLRPFLAESSSSAPPAAPASGGAAAPMVPDIAIPTGALKALDADLTLKAARLILAQDEISDLSATGRLRGGKLTLDPLAAVLKGAALTGNLTLDASGRVPRLDVAAHAARVDYGALLKERGVTGLIEGMVDSADFTLAGSGNGLHEILRSGQGNMGLVAGSGRLETALIESWGADLARALAPALRDRITIINCGVDRMNFSGGRAETAGMVLDTNHAALTVKGGFDLVTGDLDMTLLPRFKVAGLSNIPLPLHVGGKLTAPRFSLMQDVAQGAAALLLGRAGGPSLSVPYVDPAAEGNACVAALENPRPWPGSSGGAANPVDAIRQAVPTDRQGVEDMIRNQIPGGLPIPVPGRAPAAAPTPAPAPALDSDSGADAGAAEPEAEPTPAPAPASEPEPEPEPAPESDPVEQGRQIFDMFQGGSGGR